MYGGELMALGHFSTPTANIAHWNGSDWLNLTSPVVVNALATFGSKMALAGSFSQYFASGHSYHVAAWNGQQLQPLTTGTNAPVRALVGYTESAPPRATAWSWPATSPWPAASPPIAWPCTPSRTTSSAAAGRSWETDSTARCTP